MTLMGALRTTVMVIESQPILRDALATALSAAGMTILAAMADGGEVTSVASSLTPDLILLSIGTPGTSELNILRVLQDTCPHARIITLVTGEMPWQEQAARNQGAHLVLTKSTSCSELLNAIKKITLHGISTSRLQ